MLEERNWTKVTTKNGREIKREDCIMLVRVDEKEQMYREMQERRKEQFGNMRF